MADISINITIPDANVAEVSEALGVSTKAQFENWVKTAIKNEVKTHRRNQVEATEQAKVFAAETDKDTAIATAVDAVDTDIVLG